MTTTRKVLDGRDSDLSITFWRETPHVYVKAHWGPYCRVCLDPKKTESKIHKVKTDPSTHRGNLTNYRVPKPPEQRVYAVNGWSEEGGGCSYGVDDTYEEALARIERYRAEGDERGDTYQHYQIDERTYYAAVDTNVAVIC